MMCPIINGARGLVYFGGNNEGAMNELDKKLGWNWQFWERVLRPVIEEIGTKSPLYPALVAPDVPLKVTVKVKGQSKKLVASADAESEPARGIEFCVLQVGSELFVLVCNASSEMERVEFSGLLATAAKGVLLYEEPRTVQAKEGSFTDWFAPYEGHVYRLHL